MIHSKLPWKSHFSTRRNRMMITSAGEETHIISADILTCNDAHFIVEACNNYETQKIVIDEYIAENKHLKENLETSRKASGDLFLKNEKLNEALNKLMDQCKHTSESIGYKGWRIFGSDDFMMVWEDVEEIIKEAEGI